MNEMAIIIAEMKKVFENDYSGHDAWHSLRVNRVALKLAETEQCDKRLIAIASLLHDVDDAKLFTNDNYQNAKRIMTLANVDDNTAHKVIRIIKQVPFKGTESKIPDTIEGKIVQDADRLDAMGAIGIARTFAYSGAKGRDIYNPAILPMLNQNAGKHTRNNGTAVDHFYEKLFLLKNMMNTKQAREIAEKRDLFMREYIAEFLHEWEEL